MLPSLSHYNDFSGQDVGGMLYLYDYNVFINLIINKHGLLALSIFCARNAKFKAQFRPACWHIIAAFHAYFATNCGSSTLPDFAQSTRNFAMDDIIC